MKYQLVAVVALIDLDGRVLFSRRPASKDFGGYWELPGGKVEANETPDAAAVRELQEELSISTWTNCLAPLTFASHMYDGVNHVILLYVCRKWDGFPTSNESNEFKWVRANDFAQYPMLPANQGMLAILRDWI